MFESDITKCANEKCQFKEECFRYTCKGESYWQSYSTFEPDGDNCEFFIFNKNKVTQHSWQMQCPDKAKMPGSIPGVTTIIKL